MLYCLKYAIIKLASLIYKTSYSMSIQKLKNTAFVLSSKEQAQIKGGTDSSNTSNSIVSGDIDVF